MVEDGIVALVKQVLAGAAQGPFDTILPETISLATLPALTYMIVGGRSKPGLTQSGPQQIRVQFDIFSVDSLDGTRSGGRTGRIIREQLRTGMNGFSGLVGGVLFDSVFYIQPIDGFENTARQFRRAAEFYFNFTFTN